MKASLLAIICLLFCTGCWDMKEINQLAIVSIGGADKDPKTGKSYAYFQVINPTGATSRNAGSSKASVYTYETVETSPGRMTESSTTSVPRIIFGAHTESYVVSERYAKQGIADLINYLELNPERRTNVFLFVTDSPIIDVMNTYTVLDRIPGQFLRSLMEMHERNFASAVAPTRLKDVVEGLSRYQPIIVPIIHLKGATPGSRTDRLEDIEGTKQALVITDGAVFIQGRMVGRMDRETKKVCFILTRRATMAVISFTVNRSQIDVEAQDAHVKMKLDLPSNRLALSVKAKLRILTNSENKKLTEQNLQEIEQAFNKKFEREAEAIVDFGRERNWDLLGLQDRGVAPTKWKNTKITFHIDSSVISTGNINKPYIPGEME